MCRSVSVMLVAALAAGALGACSEGPDEHTIVGTWRGTVNGTEQTYTFGADGTFRIVYDNHVDEGTYETSDTLAIVRIHVTSGVAGGLPVVADERYTGAYAISSDGERMTLSVQADPPPEDGQATVVMLRRL